METGLLISLLTLGVVSFCFYMEIDKLKKTIAANKAQSDNALSAMSARLRDTHQSVFENKKSITENNKQVAELARLCGAEHGTLHNLAAGASEAIESLRSTTTRHSDTIGDLAVDTKMRILGLMGRLNVLETKKTKKLAKSPRK